jgi:hypothetical protein
LIGRTCRPPVFGKAKNRTERLQGDCEEKHHSDACMVSEAKGEIVEPKSESQAAWGPHDLARGKMNVCLACCGIGLTDHPPGWPLIDT